MTTLSQMADELALEMARPESALFIASAINQTIREVHTGQNGVRHRFNSNRVEQIINVPPGNDTQYNWEIPNISCFQASEAYYYAARGRYAVERPPGLVNINARESIADLYYWYQSGNYICFFGYGPGESQILSSAFYYPRSLKYQPEESLRWAEFNEDTQTWVYNSDSTYTEEQKREMVSNWILMRWPDMIREGARAKMYKKMDDQRRAALSYSAWQDQRLAFQMQEITQQESNYYR